MPRGLSVKRGAVTRALLYNFAIDGIMRKISAQYSGGIVLAPSDRLLTHLEYANNVVVFAEGSTKRLHVVHLESKLAAPMDYICTVINLLLEIEEVGYSYAQGRHTSARIRKVASIDDISLSIKPSYLNLVSFCETRWDV
ncbi:hypothetical protein RB195_010591 [Necator americanus]|uniref:Reverse transcriptase domain-containing protein n=1 Tax=Necator americanus TaxID=51031 RepID=A0ABR1CZR8_NECAM